MTPAPNLQELIESVRADAESTDALDQLTTASRTMAELEDVVDAVLAHFVDQCRRAGRSWSQISTALGVTKQAAHKRFSLSAAALERFAEPTFERFTPRARSVLRAAVEEAKALGHAEVGSEHLLLGLFEPSGGIAAQVLGEIGIARDQVVGQIVRISPRGTETIADPPFGAAAKSALGLAVSEPLRFGHNYIGTEHLLIALFDGADDNAATVLATLGARRDDVRGRVVAKLAQLS